MVYGQNEMDVALDKKRHEVEERLARDTRIGWLALAAVASLIVAGAVIVAYLFLEVHIIR
jgi:hypothetical protein